MKLRSIQVLRGLAALAVVLCHAGAWPSGAFGVDLFFVISGFIIATIAGQRTPGQFLLDRAWRIYPIYWIATVPWLLLAVHTGQLTLERTWASVTLWPIYSEYSNPYLRAAWTLCFEMLFYSAAAIALLFRKAVPLAVFGVCFVVNLFHPTPFTGFLGSPLILEFLAGAAITLLPRQFLIGAVLLAVGIAGLLLSPVFHQIGVDQPIERIFYWGLPAALVVYGSLSLEDLVTGWADSFVKLGDASYSVYLWHLWPAVLLPAYAAVPAAVVIGLLSYRYIERPILNARTKHLSVSNVIFRPRPSDRKS